MKNKNILTSSWRETLPSFIRSIGEGYKFIKENKFILAPFLLMVSMQVALTITLVNAPSFTAEITKIPLAFAGIYLVVPGGIGAFLATLVIPRWLTQGLRKVKLIKACLFVLAFSLLTITYVFSNFPDFQRVTFSFLTLAVMGFSYVGILIPAQTFLQEHTPDQLRGRVFGNFWFLVVVITIIPVILSGTISQILGAKALMFVLSILITGLIFFLVRYEKRYLLTGIIR
jgi:MFS family permease